VSKVIDQFVDEGRRRRPHGEASAVRHALVLFEEEPWIVLPVVLLPGGDLHVLQRTREEGRQERPEAVLETPGLRQ